MSVLERTARTRYPGAWNVNPALMVRRDRPAHAESVYFTTEGEAADRVVGHMDMQVFKDHDDG